MHNYFAEWYRVADIEPRSEVLTVRWAGIESLVSNLDIAAGIEWVRLFLGKPLKDSARMESFREAFHAADAAFPVRGNDLELRVLAGALLVNALDQDTSYLEDSLALALVCADFRGLAPRPPVPDILEYARAYLDTNAVQARECTSFSIIGLPENTTEELAAACQPNNIPGLAAPLGNVVKTLGSVISALGELNSTQDHWQEKAEILWWVFGEHSRDMECRMASLDLPVACLIAAKELADLTRALPGPRAARAYLDKTIAAGRTGSGSKIPLRDAVNASPKAWRDKHIVPMASKSIEDLCPTLFALRKSTETSDPGSWGPFLERACGVKPEMALEPVDLALQAYEEHLLVRAYGEAGEA